MKKVKVFDIDYLANEELTDEDLHYLLDKHSLIYSLVVAEINKVKPGKNKTDIINEITLSNQWQNKYKWTKKNYSDFYSLLTKVYKNVYNYNTKMCEQYADVFMLLYGIKTI